MNDCYCFVVNALPSVQGNSALSSAPLPAVCASRGSYRVCVSSCASGLHFPSREQQQAQQGACHSHCASLLLHSPQSTVQSEVNSAASHAATAAVSRVGEACGLASATKGEERGREGGGRESLGGGGPQVGERLTSAVAAVMPVTSAEDRRGGKDRSKKRRQESEGEGEGAGEGDGGRGEVRDVRYGRSGHAVSSAPEGAGKTVEAQCCETRDKELMAVDLHAVERVEKMVGKVQVRNGNAVLTRSTGAVQSSKMPC